MSIVLRFWVSGLNKLIYEWSDYVFMCIDSWIVHINGFQAGINCKELACQLRRHEKLGFDLWVDPLENGMTIHSSILAWRIPWTEEPGWLQSMGSQRDRHDWGNLAKQQWINVFVIPWKSWTLALLLLTRKAVTVCYYTLWEHLDIGCQLFFHEVYIL